MRRKRQTNFAKSAGVALVLIASTAACSGSQLPPCSLGNALPPPTFYMVSPSPGATGVPDNLSGIVFAGFAPNDLVLAGGTQNIALSLEAAPTPAPTPDGALPELIATLSTQLSARTAYTITYNATLSYSGCQSHNYTITVGSFTTQ